MTGKIIGLARRAVSRAPMEEIQRAQITLENGVEGDCKGAKFPNRQVTVLAVEDWKMALKELGNPQLPWTTRRANVLVEGLRLPRGIGSIILLGSAVLEVTEQTTPCALMDYFHQGLRRALAPDWRGGITCKVLEPGELALGDTASVSQEIVQQKVRLPG